MHYETLWKFETANFRVEWAITEEPDPDFSFDDSGETADKVASGEWTCFLSRMRVVHVPTGATLGEDFLGNSIYANPAEFRDHIGAQGKYGSYFRDMVRSSVAESRDAMRKMQGIRVR
jgi:hypothetical protein